MTTEELIEKLKELDPSGKKRVVVKSYSWNDDPFWSDPEFENVLVDEQEAVQIF